jgi:hypothetical protein
MAIERSKEQAERQDKPGSDKDRHIFDPKSGKHRQQPGPKVPLFSGGEDPTLGERFEEELYRS